MSRRLGSDPDKLFRRDVRFTLNRAGAVVDASPRAMNWLARFGLTEPANAHPLTHLTSPWTQRLWQLADDPQPQQPLELPVRLRLRRGLIVRIESIQDGQICCQLQILHTHAKIDPLWWSILGDDA